jgi:hypothetical protein
MLWQGGKFELESLTEFVIEEGSKYEVPITYNMVFEKLKAIFQFNYKNTVIKRKIPREDFVCLLIITRDNIRVNIRFKFEKK